MPKVAHATNYLLKNSSSIYQREEIAQVIGDVILVHETVGSGCPGALYLSEGKPKDKQVPAIISAGVKLIN